jgi:hypothetical protein
MAVGEPAQSHQHVHIVEKHAARALHQRLDNDPGDLVGMARDDAGEMRKSFLIARQIAEQMSRQQSTERMVHAVFGIGDRHGAGGVAVVAAVECHEARPPYDALVAPVLHRHLHGDLDRDRSGIRKEHPVKARRHQCGEPAGQRQRRFMSEPAEHDMRHHIKLAPHCRRDMGVIVAVAGGPPRGDAVDQLAPICQHDAAAPRRHHRKRIARDLHLRIGQPDVGHAGREPGGRGGGLDFR